MVVSSCVWEAGIGNNISKSVSTCQSWPRCDEPSRHSAVIERLPSMVCGAGHRRMLPNLLEHAFVGCGCRASFQEANVGARQAVVIGPTNCQVLPEGGIHEQNLMVAKRPCENEKHGSAWRTPEAPSSETCRTIWLPGDKRLCVTVSR